MEPFWTVVNEAALRQGDLLPDCWIPEFPTDFADLSKEARIIQADQASLIVITQSCDLEHGKVALVALCPIWPIPVFEAAQESQGQTKSVKSWRDYWNHVRNGRSPTLHLLASPTSPAEARAALLVDFRAIYSLPLAYLIRHAQQIGDRWRLRSPYLEHFSQAFSRSFMRVGLPSSVPEF
jgi:hypothetical protein